MYVPGTELYIYLFVFSYLCSCFFLAYELFLVFSCCSVLVLLCCSFCRVLPRVVVVVAFLEMQS